MASKGRVTLERPFAAALVAAAPGEGGAWVSLPGAIARAIEKRAQRSGELRTSTCRTCSGSSRH